MKGKIEIDLDHMGRGTIKINGEPVKGVTRITFEQNAGELGTVALSLIGYAVTVNSVGFAEYQPIDINVFGGEKE